MPQSRLWNTRRRDIGIIEHKRGSQGAGKYKGCWLEMFETLLLSVIIHTGQTQSGSFTSLRRSQYLKMSTCLASILVMIVSLLHLSHAALPFGNAGPIGAVLFFNGFHFLSGNSLAKVSVDHYCTILSDDFIQCVIYNTNSIPAHLADINYIISLKLFETLEMTERELWHSPSHSYEVTSRFLIEPHMPASIDLSMMEVLVGMYGKTAQGDMMLRI
jgi:Protein of unknown function (DUF1264)